MADITLAGSVTRTALGMGDLNINDYSAYFLGSALELGEDRWERSSTGGAHMLGEVTTARTKKNITRVVPIEVLGTSHANLEANITALKQAFNQDSYQLTLTYNGTTHTYAAEAADVSYPGWITGRITGRVVLVVFSVPCRPIPVAGGF